MQLSRAAGMLVLVLLALVLSLVALAGPGAAAPGAPATPLLPRAVPVGSTVGFVTPAGALSVNETEYRAKIDAIVQRLGLRAKFGAHAFGRHGYFGGTDQERAADFMAFIDDPQVSAIVCNRGGWGTARILGLLDMDRIRAARKVIMGYSDITALLNGISTTTGLITFHGPMGVDDWSDNMNLEGVKNILISGLAPVLRNSARFGDWQRIAGGRARGRLVGGNLAVYTNLMGSPWVPPQISGPTIFFFEEVSEAPYRIDRMLTQLVVSGQLSSIAGFLFGRCTRCDGTNFSWTEVIRQHLGSLQIPAFIGSQFGHNLPGQFVLPVGGLVEIDADEGTIRLLEPAVELRLSRRVVPGHAPVNR